MPFVVQMIESERGWGSKLDEEKGFETEEEVLLNDTVFVYLDTYIKINVRWISGKMITDTLKDERIEFK